jgi:Transglutaminase-like superfamily/Bacterial transglutaminase-like N-terminal region
VTITARTKVMIMKATKVDDVVMEKQMLKRIKIIHKTKYQYNAPVTFGAHRLMMRPREGHDVHIVNGRLSVEPEANIRRWLADLYQPGQIIGTFELLEKLNTQIYRSLSYAHRDDSGVQLPCDTLARGSGSCRDFAVLMMEAARHWGFGARFVSGYIQMAEGQHGATHAWTEIYIPGAGWRGFDPTNNKLSGNEHVSVAVAREQEKALPVSGTWEGPANAFTRMEVSVQVVSV